MTPEARDYIVKCFCRTMTPVEVAYCANNLFDLHGHVIDAATVRRIWKEARENNTVIKQLEEQFGTRPVKGFPDSEHMRLAERLVVV